MNIKIDSRKIEKGDIFVALKTLNHDGHDYVMDAISKGASKVIVEYGSYPVETITVPSTKDYLISYLKNNYYSEIKDLKLIGITGTNGKTTTCYSIWQACNKLGHKCAYIGTLGFYKEAFVRELDNTTPEILDLYEMLLECAKEGFEYVVMEASSHALSLKRLESLLFTYVFFTNLTEDHLDYHKTMEEYAKAKQKLFYQVKENGVSIVNTDDPYKDFYLLNQNQIITYGYQKSDYQIKNPKCSENGISFTLKNVRYKSSFLGKHNMNNLTCVLIFLDLIGVSDRVKQTVLKELEPPKGRMEVIKYKTNSIIVDYAHTPDAMEKIIETVKEFCKGKLYVIIGCGGERDPYKRPLMAKIATTKCDYAIFTNDNPRMEDPNKIFQDMIQKLDNQNYEIIQNREKAIHKGIQICTKNDILLVLGKGHETYQIIGTEKTHFDDKEVILKTIRS